MNKAIKTIVVAAVLAAAQSTSATPSTIFWTPATTYTQPYLLPHVTYDTYFGEQGSLPIDTGITMGVLPFEKLQAEVGFDLLYPGYTKDGFLLNAKLALPEGAFGKYVPGFSVGVQNVGFDKDVNDLYLVHATLGKTSPIGAVAVGAYYGVNPKLMTDETGKEQRAGLMVSWTSPDIGIGKPGLEKIVFMADAMTGRSAFGAVGGGVGVFFTKDIAVLAGPVFFLNKDVQPGTAPWLFSFQLDVDADILRTSR